MIVNIESHGDDTFTAYISNPPIILKYSVKNEDSYTVKYIEDEN